MMGTKIHDVLRDHARQIWLAGVEAVRADRLVRRWLRIEDHWLIIGENREVCLDLNTIQRIVVVGAGKAGAGMVDGLEMAIPPAVAVEKHLSGWVNVPADCVKPTRWIHLHAARPPGLNEPTAEGVYGARRIMEIVEGLGPDDLCLCLLSGGGSALLPAPISGVSLADKQAVTRFLSAAGANIAELNTVRKQLSSIKGGGLLKRCRAGVLVSLIISDVLGDPLEVIASGPTVLDSSSPADALEILQRYGAREGGVPETVFRVLERRAGEKEEHLGGQGQVFNFVIGNNRTAVEAAAAEASRLGYRVRAESAMELEGCAEDVGRELARESLKMVASGAASCFVSGGEPVVRLAPVERRGMGGRNQQLVLAAAEHLWGSFPSGVIILSGGTDGEDGPTDAAGAFVDSRVIEEAKTRRMLSPSDYLERNDAYHFFEPLGALLRTGPTHTNVCDVRVVLVRGQTDG